MPTTCLSRSRPTRPKTTPQVGRGNAIMGGMAKQFTNAELKELANYVGSLPR